MSEDTCFNHPDAAKAGTCKYCGKSYCADCLLLQGPLNSLMCVNCHAVIRDKSSTSIIINSILIAIGAAGSILAFFMPSYKLTGVIFLFLLARGIVRICKIKQALKVRPYAESSAQMTPPRR